MLGKSTIPPKADPKQLLKRRDPDDCWLSEHKLMGGAEIIAGLPSLASYGIVADKQYYLHGFVARSATNRGYIKTTPADDSAIERLASVIFIGAGGKGGNGAEYFYGTQGLAGSMDFKDMKGIPRALPADIVAISSDVANGNVAFQRLDIMDNGSLWNIISNARNGSNGVDGGGSSNIENGQDGPFRLLWSADRRIADGESSSTGVGGGYGPGAGGAGGNIGQWLGGKGADGGVVLFFELR